MAVLDRLKTRFETDLSDAELQLMIDAETAEIDARFGAIAAITVLEDGARRFIVPARPIDTAQAVTIVEIYPRNTGDSANRTTLAADDYRIADGGHAVERLIDGTNGLGSWSKLVEMTYTPIGNQKQRDEALIKLVTLSLTWQGLVKSESVGDSNQSGNADPQAYQREREAIFQGIAPRGRMAMA